METSENHTDNAGDNDTDSAGPADPLLGALNAAVETLLDLDPDTQRRLAAMHDSVFCLECTAPPFQLYLGPSQRGLEFHRTAQRAPDVTLSGPLTAFARLGWPGSGGAAGALGEGRVTVRGDAELGREFQHILAGLDLDWEELLARAIGDTPARKVGNALRAAAGWAEESFDLSRENAADYLTEEKRILVDEAALQRFGRDLDHTRADVDRLTRRVERLCRVLDARCA